MNLANAIAAALPPAHALILLVVQRYSLIAEKGQVPIQALVSALIREGSGVNVSWALPECENGTSVSSELEADLDELHRRGLILCTPTLHVAPTALGLAVANSVDLGVA